MTAAPTLVRGRFRGFTLIELIVVIVIMGILVAIGAFAYNAIVDNSRSTGVKATAEQVGKTLQGVSAAKGKAVTDFDAAEIQSADEDAEGAAITAEPASGGTRVVTVCKDGYCVPVTFTDSVGAKYTVGTPVKDGDATAPGGSGGGGGTGPEGMAAATSSLLKEMEAFAKTKTPRRGVVSVQSYAAAGYAPGEDLKVWDGSVVDVLATTVPFRTFAFSYEFYPEANGPAAAGAAAWQLMIGDQATDTVLVIVGGNDKMKAAYASMGRPDYFSDQLDELAEENGWRADQVDHSSGTVTLSVAQFQEWQPQTQW